MLCLQGVCWGIEGSWTVIGQDEAQGSTDAVGCVEIDSGRTVFDCTALEGGNDPVGWGALGCPLPEVVIAESDVSEEEVEQGWSLK